MEPHRAGYHSQTAQGHHRPPNPAAVQNQFDQSYHQPYASSVARGPYVRSHPQHEREPYNRSHSQHERNNRSTPQNRDYPMHGYYQPGFQPNGGNRYPAQGPPRPGVQTPIPTGAHHRQQSGYDDYESYQRNGAAGNHNSSGSWVPPVNQSVGRGYVRPQQSGNQFSALDRGASRNPPPPGYAR